MEIRTLARKNTILSLNKNATKSKPLPTDQKITSDYKIHK